jgi:hypothetical protein
MPSRIRRYKVNATSVLRGAVGAVGVGLIVATCMSTAQAHGQPCDALCITDLSQDGSRLHVAWSAQQMSDYYLIAWNGGFGEQSQRVGGGTAGAFDIPDVQPGATYDVRVLGCSLFTPFWRDSPCGLMDQRFITT